LKAKSAYIGALSALLGTCVFGRMSFLASTGAIENPDPTQFQQFATLWRSLYWIVPALVLGILIRYRLVLVAAAVHLAGGLVLLAFEYSHFVPKGQLFPLPRDLLGMGAELILGIPVAIFLAWLVRKTSVKFSGRRWA